MEASGSSTGVVGFSSVKDDPSGSAGGSANETAGTGCVGGRD